jgi:hypothetical protein
LDQAFIWVFGLDLAPQRYGDWHMVLRPILDNEPITIIDAYDDLTNPAFAVWMRLLVTPEKSLTNREKLAVKLHYSTAGLDNILGELKRKGYIQIQTPSRPGLPSKIIISRRAKIFGRNKIVTLSNFAHCPETDLTASLHLPLHEPRIPVTPLPQKALEIVDQFAGALHSFASDTEQNKAKKDGEKASKPEKKQPKKSSTKLGLGGTQTTHGVKGRTMPKTRRKLTDSGAVDDIFAELIHAEFFSDSHHFGGHGKAKAYNGPSLISNSDTTLRDSNNNTDKTSKTTKPKGVSPKTKGHSEEQDKQTDDVSSSLSPKGDKPTKINLDKFKKKVEAKKEKMSKAARKGVATKKRNSQFPKRKPKLDWTKLDQFGNPAISFSPSLKERKKYVAILSKPATNPHKIKLIKKLASEFGRLYARYRRMLQKEAGNEPSYLMPDEERKYAGLAAEWCIRKGVTPRQVLNYWHINISNFAECTLKIPPLVFLSGAANIDTVACSAMESDDAGWKAGQPKSAKAVTHGFSDTNQLDIRLRAGLERAGIETQLYSDRYLLTVQKAAEAIAKGHKLFVPSKIRGMVDWAVGNLYQEG